MSEISSFAQKMVDDCLLYCALILFLPLRSFEDDQWYSFNDQTVSKVFFNSCNCLTEFDCFFKPRSTLVRDAKVVKLTSKIYEGRKQFSYHFPVLIPYRHRIKISNRRATQRCNVSSFFYAKICSLLARRRSSQPVQRVYWPENVSDWLGKWRPTCVMRHARGQKLQSFRRKWPFYMDLYSMVSLNKWSVHKTVVLFLKLRVNTEFVQKLKVLECP